MLKELRNNYMTNNLIQTQQAIGINITFELVTTTLNGLEDWVQRLRS